MSKMYSIYNVKFSKKGDRINLNLISDSEDYGREFGCISLSLANKEKVCIVDNNNEKYVYLKFKINEDSKKEKSDKTGKINEDSKKEKSDKTGKTDKQPLPF